MPSANGPFKGPWHLHCSEKQLQRYLNEFDLCHKSRNVTDFERAALGQKGAERKPLTYLRTALGANA